VKKNKSELRIWKWRNIGHRAVTAVSKRAGAHDS